MELPICLLTQLSLASEFALIESARDVAAVRQEYDIPALFPYR
jgi:hypothetical protein